MTSKRLLACSLLLTVAACGGGGGGTGPSTMPPEPTYSVSTVVFYDENGNGTLDGSEGVRLQQVDVVVGGVSAKSGAGGQAVVAGVKAGSQTVAIRTESLPPFFVPTVPLPVQVPQSGGEVRLAVRLPIGDNLPNRYLAFGDSLTVGEGSSDGNGYRLKLQSRLAGSLGRAEVINAGQSGRDSRNGAARIPGKNGLEHRPAYTLILYGTNDWNDQSCQSSPPANCFTMESLLTMVEEVKDRDSIPVLATLPPVNPAINPGRNVWHDQMNEMIKALARSQGAVLADLNAAFKARGNLPTLFDPSDSAGVHPNDAGYDIMADTFLKAITGARSASAASRSLPLFLAAPPAF
jgi:lysophospholipase L1-like esterase